METIKGSGRNLPGPRNLRTQGATSGTEQSFNVFRQGRNSLGGATQTHLLAYAVRGGATPDPPCLQVRGNVRRCRSAQMCGEVKSCTYRSAKKKEDKCRQRKHSDEHMARRKRSNGWIEKEDEEEELRRAAAENDVDVRLRGGTTV